MKLVKIVSLACCALASVVSLAQSEKVLEPAATTEQALVDMLSPDAAPAKKRTRSISVTREEAPPASARPATASLLITFETNSAGLTPAARESLDVVGRALQSDKLVAYRFAIEVHTDPRGGEDYNRRLSQSRAESVAAYLAENHHVDRNRLQPVGKGPSQLLNPARPEAPENRRVTIKRLDD